MDFVIRLLSDDPHVSKWDSETQAGFRNSITDLLSQHDFDDVAGIIVAAPDWFVFENELYQDHNDLKSSGLFDLICVLKMRNRS